MLSSMLTWCVYVVMEKQCYLLEFTKIVIFERHNRGEASKPLCIRMTGHRFDIFHNDKDSPANKRTKKKIKVRYLCIEKYN